MADVFISYAREDGDIARRLYDDLRARGIDPWLDVESLDAGSNWKREIGIAIRDSKFVIILLSESAVSKRGYVQKEVKDAIEVLDEFPESEIFVIPARINDCKPTSQRLADLNWVDLFPSYEKGFDRILRTLVKDSEIRESVENIGLQAEEKGLSPHAKLYSRFLDKSESIFSNMHFANGFLDKDSTLYREKVQEFSGLVAKESKELQEMLTEINVSASEEVSSAANAVMATIKGWELALSLLTVQGSSSRQDTIQKMRHFDTELFLKDLKPNFLERVRKEIHGK